MTIIYLFTYAHRSPSVFLILILIVSCYLAHSHPFTLPTVLTGH